MPGRPLPSHLPHSHRDCRPNNILYLQFPALPKAIVRAYPSGSLVAQRRMHKYLCIYIPAHIRKFRSCPFLPAITSTRTLYCREGGCGGITTDCSQVYTYTATVYPPCPSTCPGCPRPVETVGVACTTSVEGEFTGFPSLETGAE